MRRGLRWQSIQRWADGRHQNQRAAASAESAGGTPAGIVDIEVSPFRGDDECIPVCAVCAGCKNEREQCLSYYLRRCEVKA